MKTRVRWGWVLLACVVGFNVGQCTNNTAHAEARGQEVRALERIARALEKRCPSK